MRNNYDNYDSMCCRCNNMSRKDEMCDMKNCCQKDMDPCHCCDPLFELPLAQAFVRPQTYGKTLSPMEGLCHGTIFPELLSQYR